MNSFKEMLKRINKTQAIVAVAAAEDESVIEAAAKAVDEGIAKFMLFGDEDQISQIIIKNANLDPKSFIIRHAKTADEACISAIKAIKNQEANILMKGKIATANLLKLVLHKERGLRTDSLLSHVAIFEIKELNRFITITDAAINLYPTIENKKQMIDNAVKVVKNIGVHIPKVAVLAAVEVVNPAMQSTVDAAILTQMNKRGQILDCIVDGPLALDNAISIESARQKYIESPVAGFADIILAPNIETGNSLYKSLIYFANANVGAIVAGAKAPIVLTSRADSSESRFNSLVLALYQSQQQDKGI